MERNSIISDEQVKTAVDALTEVASGKNSGSVQPEQRVRAAETLLGHAWVYGEPTVAPAAEDGQAS